MPRFSVNGVDSKGEERSALVGAKDEREALERAKENGVFGMTVTPVRKNSVPPRLFGQSFATISEFLSTFVEREIGINFREPEMIRPATLLDVAADHLAVRDDEGVVYRFPLSRILRITHAEIGPVRSGGYFSKEYEVIVEVFHLVIYKGAVGIGISVPLE